MIKNIFVESCSSSVMWRIDARYTPGGRIILSEVETSETVKNSIIRRLKSRGYIITVEQFTRGQMMETFCDIPALKNKETEAFCQQVATEHCVDKGRAEKMFFDFCKNNKNIVSWEVNAMIERIQQLVSEQSNPLI